MKIAIVSPVMVPVPPKKYGGIELIVDELTRGLAGKGHKVAVFCCGGSTIEQEGISRIETCPYPTSEHIEENRKWELNQILTVLGRQQEFDVIHFNYEPAVFRFDIDGIVVNLLDFFTVPVALAFHNTTDIKANVEYYHNALSLHRHEMIFVSENQRRPVSFFPIKVMDFEKIRRPKIPKRRVDYLTEEELKKFFNSIGKSCTRDFRFRALVSVLISTGCRISEALNLKIRDIDWDKKEAMIVEKGNKQRKLYFTDWSLACIKEYIEKRGYDGKFIFIAEGKKNRWDRNDAQRNFRNYRRRLGLSSNFTAHTIRHSFATLLLKKGVILGHIQVLLGHSDIQTTSRHYLGILSDDEAKEAHKKHMDMDSWL